MKTKIIITKMIPGAVIEKDFITEKQARDYFYGFCDEHDMQYEQDSEEAGGIGHDYRIELVEATNV